MKTLKFTFQKEKLPLLRLLSGALLFLPSLASAQTLPSRMNQIKTEDVLYEKLYPNYAEFCAVSQLSPIFEESGGSPGHATLYLSGACYDQSAGYPRIVECKEKPKNYDKGVLISVDSAFKNVNWMATPGKRLGYYSDLDEKTILTKELRDNLLKELVNLGVFRGIKVHDSEDHDTLKEWKTPGHPYSKENLMKAWEGDPNQAEKAKEHYVAYLGMSTDFLLQMGRELYCARYPLTPVMLTRTVNYLNQANEHYFNHPEDPYYWAGSKNNCAHLAWNALAINSGNNGQDLLRETVNGSIKDKTNGFTDRIEILHTIKKNFTLPSNRYIEVARIGNDDAIDFLSLQRNYKMRNGFDRLGILATQPGAITIVYPKHGGGNPETGVGSNQTLNDLYKVDSPKLLHYLTFRKDLKESFMRIFDLKTPIVVSYPQFDASRFKNYTFGRGENTRYHSIRDNLEYFKSLYSENLESIWPNYREEETMSRRSAWEALHRLNTDKRLNQGTRVAVSVYPLLAPLSEVNLDRMQRYGNYLKQEIKKVEDRIEVIRSND